MEFMRNVLAEFPGEFFSDGVTVVSTDADVGLSNRRADVLLRGEDGTEAAILLFRVVSRATCGQLAGYRRRLHEDDVRLHVVANHIAAERRHFLSRIGIRCQEIPESRFRSVAGRHGEPEMTPSDDDSKPPATRRSSRDLGPGAYPAEALVGLSGSFEQATHKIWDLRTGKNSWDTDGTPLTEFVERCGKEVSSLARREVLHGAEISHLAFAHRVADLSGEQREQLLKREAEAELDLPASLATALITVTHRVRANKGSEDPKCTRHLDRSLEVIVDEALEALGSAVPFLRREKPGRPPRPITAELCLELLTRIDVPPGQQQLYRALLKAGDRGLETDELIQEMGRRDADDLHGVLGALGNRLNRTPGFDGEPGIGAILDVSEGERGGWRYRLKPVMEDALQRLAPKWLL